MPVFGFDLSVGCTSQSVIIVFITLQNQSAPSQMTIAALKSAAHKSANLTMHRIIVAAELCLSPEGGPKLFDATTALRQTSA
jgi:hypothetical protein